MTNKFANRFVFPSLLISGISFGLPAKADDNNPLQTPIVPPNLLTPSEGDIEVLPQLPAANGEVISVPYVAEDAEVIVGQDAPSLEVTEEYVNENRETIRERYPDGSIKVERFVALDSNGNYVNDGTYRMYGVNGTLLAQGKYIMGTQDGAWQRIYAKDDAKIFAAYPYNEFQGPYISKAVFTGGNMNGTWEITDSQGKIISEIPFRDGLRHGRAVWNHPNGKPMYEATYNDGMLEGRMAEYNEAGQKLTDFNFTNGRRVEKEVEHHPNRQLKAEYEYISAQQELKERDDWWNAKPAVYEKAGKRVRQGAFTEWHSNGQKKATGRYEEDRLAGDFASWFENGQRETRGSYTLGTPEGEWVWWHANGMRRAKGSYMNGTPDGEWTSWSPEGKLAKRQTYSDAAPGRSGTVVRTQPPTTVRRSNSARQPQYRRPVR